MAESDNALRQKIRDYAHLKAAKGEEFFVPPSEQAIKDLLTFLDHRPAEIPLPHPQVGTDGEIGVYWDNRKLRVFAEVSLIGDGTYDYYAIQGEHNSFDEKHGGDSEEVCGNWPDGLLKVLRYLVQT